MEMLDRTELLKILETRSNVKVLDILDACVYQNGHIPGAVNVPYQGAEFDRDILRVVPDLSSPVIVYGAGGECRIAHEAAARMEQLGYSQVYLYPAGKAEWCLVGLPFEAAAGGLPKACCRSSGQ